MPDVVSDMVPHRTSKMATYTIEVGVVMTDDMCREDECRKRKG